VNATVLRAFAAFRGRAGFVAGPVDGGAQLVLCGQKPFCEATELFGLEAFA
jgi:hypothetical protein